MSFKEKVGFNHQQKIKKLNLIIKSYKSTYKRSEDNFLKLLDEINKVRNISISKLVKRDSLPDFPFKEQ